MTVTVAPFGDYTGIAAGTGVTKATINAALANLKLLIPDTKATASGHSGAVAAPSPEFDRIDPEMRTKLRAEIDAIIAAVTAA